MKMKLQDKLIGSAGVAVLLFSLIYYSIQNIWEVINWVTFVAGLAGSGYFLYAYFKHREKEISRRNLQYGSNVLLQIVIVIGIIGLLAFITTRQHLRSDLTENKLYSLADQTEKIMEGLEKDVKITAFVKTSDQRGVQDMLDEYVYRSGKLTVQFVDPDEEPQIARQYQINKYGTMIVESGLKKETVNELSEAKLTNAIMKVTRDQDKVIYFLTGHGERSIQDEGPEGYKQAADAIKNENHMVREFNLVRNIAQGSGVPDSCTVLVVLRPQSNFFPGELDSIRQFVDDGGKALFLLDPERPDDLAAMLMNYGVEVGNDLVIDISGMGRLFGAGPAMPLVTEYDNTIPITEEFGVMTFYPQTASVTPLDAKNGYTVKELLKTSANSYAEKDFLTGLSTGSVTFNDGVDVQGPITIATVMEKTIESKKSALAVFGDSDFAKNGMWKNQGNSDLFLNTVNYLAEEEDLISIRPKEYDDRRVTLTMADVTTIFYLVVIIIPLLVIIAGVVFYVKRGK